MMRIILINPTEIAYAAEHAVGGRPHLRPLVFKARNDGRQTKPGEIKRMWAAFLKTHR